MTTTQNTFAEGLKSTFDKQANLECGENGALQHTMKGMGGSRQVEGALVAWNVGVTRNAPSSKIDELIENVFKSIDNSDLDESAQDIINLFKSVFVKRDCREGEGERMVVYHSLFKLYDYYPNTVLKLLEFIPEFGYWKDYQNIYRIAHDMQISRNLGSVLGGLRDTVKEKTNAFMTKIREIWVTNFHNDWNAYCEKHTGDNKSSLTLMTKYWPKEGRSLDKTTKVTHILAKEIMVKNKPIGLRILRDRLSKMNEAINTTEVLMSAKRWDELKFNLVPSRLMTLGRNAFLNLDKNGNMRHPDDAIRMQCRQNLLDHVELAKQNKTKIHGGQLFIHEIIKQYVPNNSYDFNPIMLDKDTQDILELQWKEHRDKILKKINDSNDTKLDKTLVLADFSGSMYGTPIMVSTAIALMLSSVTKGHFKDMFMTFNSKPELLSINPEDSLYEKIKYVVNTRWGGNTDFVSAFDTILKTCHDNKLEPEDLPSQIMVISDMQFDSAHFNKTSGIYDCISQYTNIPIHFGRDLFGKTHHEILVDAFHNAGIAICGKPYKLPTMVYWNVRGDTYGAPARADTPNTQMLTGFSVHMIKNIFSESEIEQPTPYDTFIQSISEPRYDIIENAIKDVAEPELFAKFSVHKEIETESDDMGDWDNITENDTNEIESIKKRMLETQNKMSEMMDQLKKLSNK